MQDDFTQVFTIEPEIKEIVCEPSMIVGYGDDVSVMVSVLPAKASAGKTLILKSSSPAILRTSTESVVIGDDGTATFKMSGELPGTAGLTYTIKGYDITANSIVNVSSDFGKITATPISNIVSGSLINKGTSVILTCSTQGATIYYTLDGSCPCDVSGSRRVYDGTPIIINENVTIKAMAMAPGMTESDVAEFVYIVSDMTDISDISVKENIQISPLPIREKVNITADGKVIKSVTLFSVNGVVAASVNKASTEITLDVHTLPSGVYILNVQTEGSTISRKVLKSK